MRGSLSAAGVHHALTPMPATGEAALTVIGDTAGTRTWFAALDDAYDDLGTVDLTTLRRVATAHCTSPSSRVPRRLHQPAA